MIILQLDSKQLSNIVQNAVVAGCSYDYYKIKSFAIADGRYFTENEVNAGYPVAILGSKIAEGLFPNNPYPIGQEIKIAGKKAYVIGLFKKVKNNPSATA